MKKVHVKKLLTLASALCISLTSAFAFAPSASIEAHAAGTIVNPAPLQANSNADFSGKWTPITKDAIDCYKVVLPADGVFTLTLMQQNAGDVQFCIRNSQTLDWTSSLAISSAYGHAVNSPSTNTITTVLSAGTYYITVDSNGTLYGATKTPEYKLKTVYQSFGFSETPDSYDSPKALVLGNTYTDALSETDEADWYKVTIPENGKYTFRLSTVQNYVQFKLKDIDLREVTSKDCSLTFPNQTQDVFLDAGTYYLHITGKPTKYSFAINAAKIKNTSIAKVKSVKKKKVDVTFKNVSDAAGYQIRYSTDKNFNKNVKTKTFQLSKTRFGNGNKRIYTISKLKRHKKYYFQIRTYVERNNVRYYSDWSKTKKTKVK